MFVCLYLSYVHAYGGVYDGACACDVSVCVCGCGRNHDGRRDHHGILLKLIQMVFLNLINSINNCSTLIVVKTRRLTNIWYGRYQF